MATKFCPEQHLRIPGQEDHAAYTIRQGVYQIWEYWYHYGWHLAVPDDFGNLRMVNATSTNHSLLS